MTGPDIFTIRLGAMAGGAHPHPAAVPKGAAPLSKGEGGAGNDCAEFGNGCADFVVGPENRLAGAVVQWMLNSGEQTPGKCTYSPLVLHGPSGTGKSHLARGLAQSRPDVVYTHGADFVRELAAAIDKDTVAEFRTRHRWAGMFVLEDLTQLVQRRAAQRELLHTLDEMELREAPVVITSHIPPGDIADLPAALRSRLAGGLQLSLVPPGSASRVEILNRLAASRGVAIAPTAAKLLATGLNVTVPELQGALVELAMESAESRLQFSRDAQRSASNVTIQAEQVRCYLALRRARFQPSIAKVIKLVAKYFGVKAAKVTGPSRQRQVALARSVAIYLCRQMTGKSLQALGKQFGNRDHTTVLYSCRTLERRLASDVELRTAIANLQAALATT